MVAGSGVCMVCRLSDSDGGAGGVGVDSVRFFPLPRFRNVDLNS